VFVRGYITSTVLNRKDKIIKTYSIVTSLITLLCNTILISTDISYKWFMYNDFKISVTFINDDKYYIFKLQLICGLSSTRGESVIYGHVNEFPFDRGYKLLPLYRMKKNTIITTWW